MSSKNYALPPEQTLQRMERNSLVSTVAIGLLSILTATTLVAVMSLGNATKMLTATITAPTHIMDNEKPAEETSEPTNLQPLFSSALKTPTLMSTFSTAASRNSDGSMTITVTAETDSFDALSNTWPPDMSIETNGKTTNASAFMSQHEGEAHAHLAWTIVTASPEVDKALIGRHDMTKAVQDAISALEATESTAAETADKDARADTEVETEEKTPAKTEAAAEPEKTQTLGPDTPVWVTDAYDFYHANWDCQRFASDRQNNLPYAKTNLQRASTTLGFAACPDCAKAGD